MMPTHPMRTPTALPVARALAAASAPMSVDELSAVTGGVRHTIYTRMLAWARVGVVTVTSEQPRRYLLTTDPTTSPHCALERRSDARQRIWTVLRILKHTDVPTLVMAAETTRKTVQVFLLDLQRAGYVRRSANGNRRLGALSTFTVIRRSGPRAPTVTTPLGTDGRRRRVLVDSATGQRHDVTAPADGARRVNHNG